MKRIIAGLSPLAHFGTLAGLAALVQGLLVGVTLIGQAAADRQAGIAATAASVAELSLGAERSLMNARRQEENAIRSQDAGLLSENVYSVKLVFSDIDQIGEEIANGDPRRMGIDRLRQDLGAYDAAIRTLAETLGPAGQDARDGLSRGPADPARLIAAGQAADERFAQVQSELKLFSDGARNDMSASRRALWRIDDLTTLAMIAVVLSGGLLMIGLSVLLLRSIYAPLLFKATGAAAEGAKTPSDEKDHAPGDLGALA